MGLDFSNGLFLLAPIPVGPLNYDWFPSKLLPSELMFGADVNYFPTSDLRVVAAVAVFCCYDYRICGISSIKTTFASFVEFLSR